MSKDGPEQANHDGEGAAEKEAGRSTVKEITARRLFFGVHLSIPATTELGDLVESMQPMARSESLSLRWLPATTYHITLKYLGWAHPEVETAIGDTVPDAIDGVGSFDVSLKGIGAFPTAEKARVLWIGVDRGCRELGELANRLGGAATELGFEHEKREFHPHVTMARLPKKADVSGLALPFSEERVRASRIDRIVLFESKTDSSGAEYSVRREWPLLAR